MPHPLNVLVVDDDTSILEMFEDFFHMKDNVSIVTAKDGSEALQICERRKVDFCFTDLNMPGMDGVEFVHRIQNMDNTIPVVVMSGFPSTDNVIATLKHGVVDFLVKPFHMGGIDATIVKTLEKRDLFIENLVLKEEKKRVEQLATFNSELSEKVHDLSVLNMILQKVDCGRNSSALYERIVNLCSYITKSDESYFHVLDETMMKPLVVCCHRRDGEYTTDAVRHHVEAILKRRVSEGLPFLIKEVQPQQGSETTIRSMISVPLKIQGKIFGMLSAIMMDDKGHGFTEKDLYYLDFMGRRTAVAVENVALYENIYDNLFCTLYAFVEAIEARDPYTKQHSSRVAGYARIIGQEMGCSDEQLDLLNFSGHLHDVGKIGIRDSILLKPGPLTKEEYEVIKQHPVIGESIVSHLGLMSREQRVIRHHHERWDGSGYPDGLRAQEIPFLSRILAVADVYDAMASDRAYRRKIPIDKIIATIVGNAKTQFDADVVDGFLQAYRKKPFSEEISYANTVIGRPHVQGDGKIKKGLQVAPVDFAPGSACFPSFLPMPFAEEKKKQP